MFGNTELKVSRMEENSHEQDMPLIPMARDLRLARLIRQAEPLLKPRSPGRAGRQSTLSRDPYLYD